MNTERFWSKVKKKRGGHACWIWTAARDRQGVGRYWFEGRMEQARRVAWALLVGSLDHGVVLRPFKCGNQACVRPVHMQDQFRPQYHTGAIVPWGVKVKK